MSAIRKLASRLLCAVVRHSSSESHEWAGAMLAELDFIESDWAALFWALGSAGAILRYSTLRGLRGWFDKREKQEEGPMLKHIRRHAAGTLSGVLIAFGVLVAGFGAVRLLLALFPAVSVRREPAELLAVIVVPESIFVVAAVGLWRKRRSMAVGIVLSAVILVAHVVVHLTTH
jgi:hypothetical protein